jgi:pyridinium-3,5-biscarboxylic acid mononucleotide sulfurtransferase
MLSEKRAILEKILRVHAPLLVAYSGGVDSTCLLATAHRVLGSGVRGVTADSPSLPRAALTEALETARGFGAVVEVVATDEFGDPNYVSNPPNRCYFCRAELFSRLGVFAASHEFASIAPEEMPALTSRGQAVTDGLLRVGFGSVEVDRAGYRAVS